LEYISWNNKKSQFFGKRFSRERGKEAERAKREPENEG
jgi:hypothetical protein